LFLFWQDSLNNSSIIETAGFFVYGLLEVKLFFYKKGFGLIWYGCFYFQCGLKKVITCHYHLLLKMEGQNV